MSTRIGDLNGVTVTITRDHHGLLAHLPGEDPARLYPEARSSFFLEDMDGQARFTRDARRRVTGWSSHRTVDDSAAAGSTS